LRRSIEASQQSPACVAFCISQLRSLRGYPQN
jgi:hypothetical protein